MKHVLLFGLAAGLLAACQSTTPEPDATPAPAPVQDPTAAAPADDSCGASTHASLVGQDKSGAPVATEGRPVRVVCSTCPMTMDYNAARLNVIFDEKTGVVQKLNCG
jgi:hypothetical protein